MAFNLSRPLRPTTKPTVVVKRDAVTDEIGYDRENLFAIPLGARSRRDMLLSYTVGLGTMVISLSSPPPADAFPNKVSDKYEDRPKRRGPKPKDLGVGTRKDMVGEEYPGLKNCGPAPNCFCSTDSMEDDPEHNVPAWIWPERYGNDGERAFQQLEEVINAYQPGQNGIDGGGFQIMKSDAKGGYIYAQFESLKNGYIDDLELAVVGGMVDRAVQVRSSSRVGYLDYGVNAKRLNYIAEALRAVGWDAAGVDFRTHQDYAAQNGVK